MESIDLGSVVVKKKRKENSSGPLLGGFYEYSNNNNNNNNKRLGTDYLCVSTIFLTIPRFFVQIRGFRAWWSGSMDRHPYDLKFYRS